MHTSQIQVELSWSVDTLDCRTLHSEGRAEVIHIRNPEASQQFVQERIISPQAQREYGEGVLLLIKSKPTYSWRLLPAIQEQSAKQLDRSFLSRRNSISSNKRLPAVPVEFTAEPVPSSSKKIRRSLTPSFASLRSAAASDRSVSRQSERSESSELESVVETGDSESLRSEDEGTASLW